MVDLKFIILAMMRAEGLRWTPSAVIQLVRHQTPQCSISEIRSAIKALINDGAVIYTHRYNSTQLELNFQHRPLVISPRLTVCHAVGDETPAPHNHGIFLRQGASFGSGDHPTTRLALKALAFCIDYMRLEKHGGVSAALDIGTGSGVLAIAAVFLGITSALAIDSDPIACHEAYQNIILNNLNNRIKVSNQNIEALRATRYDLIMANIRPPTLRRLFPYMQALSKMKALWVLSGFRPESVGGLINSINAQPSQLIWKQEEHQWTAIVVQLNAQPSRTDQ